MAAHKIKIKLYLNSEKKIKTQEKSHVVNVNRLCCQLYNGGAG